ncbi:MAG: C45 family autoproteolytic acyltransferase/hydrolase [bacterium]
MTDSIESWPTTPVADIPETDTRYGSITTPQGELSYLNVSGSLSEMAYQHGTRLRTKVQTGSIAYFSKYLVKVLANSPLHSAAYTLDWGTQRLLGQKMRKQVPEEFRRAVSALADGAEMDEETVWSAYLMPETFLWVVGTYHKLLGTKSAQGLGAPPMFGCTSAIAVPPKAPTTYHGRNFDYFGIDYWDKNQVVAFHRPDSGLDYVSVTSAGMIGGGITSMNSAGLTFTMHQHFPRDLDLKGVPVGVAGDYAIRNAHTIDEAVAILREFPPVAGWTYVMSEGDTGRAAVYEVAPGHENLTWLGSSGSLGYANMYWGAALKDIEVDFFPEYRRCNVARQSRVSQCLRELPTTAGPIDIARILGDLNDPESGEQRLLGPTIVNVTTVASVVFEPENRRVWVAAGRSPTCRGWYVPFDLKSGRPDLSTDPFLPFPGWHESAQGRAFENYRRAVAMVAAGEPDQAVLVHVEHALALDPEEPYLRVLAGLLSLRMNRPERAEGAFRRAIQDIGSPDRRAEIQLYLGWSYDLLKRRTMARHTYKEVLNTPEADAVVKQRAHYGKWFRFDAERAKRLNIDLVYGGVP